LESVINVDVSRKTAAKELPEIRLDLLADDEDELAKPARFASKTA